MNNVFDTYQITEEVLKSEVYTANLYKLILVSILSIIINSLFAYIILVPRIEGFKTLQFKLIFSFSFGVFIFLLGVFGGIFWQISARKIARMIYLPYILKDKIPILSKFYFKFAEEENSHIFFEARSQDPNIRSFKGIMKLIIRISLSQLGFYITIMSVFLIQLPIDIFDAIKELGDFEFIIKSFLSLGLATVFLSLYLPSSFLLEDADIRTFNTNNRTLGIPSSKIRSVIDGIVGIGALSSGWSIFTSIRELSGNIDSTGNSYFFITGSSTLFTTFDYISWLIYIMILSWPLIFPAMIIWVREYQNNINNFRIQAIKEGVPIGVSGIRKPDSSEDKIINKFIQ